ALIFLLGQWATAFALGRPGERVRTWPTALLLLGLGVWVVLLLSLLQYTCQAQWGWRAFLYLGDLAPPALWGILVLWSPTLALWLWSLRTLEALRARIPDRGRRAAYLVGLAGLLGLLSWCDLWTIDYLPLALGAGLWWLGQDFYLDSSRTSMTWLILWLLFFAILLAAFAFRQTLLIDRAAQAEMALIIADQDTLEMPAYYHLDAGWDTISYATAPHLLPAELGPLPIGEGRALLSSGRSDYFYHRTDGKGYVQVGHDTRGYQPPLALASLLFIVGLLYILALRIGSWLLAYPLADWPYPLFGPASLRVRIQLSFFGVAFAAFGLVGWFTFSFFRAEPDFAYGLLEQLLSLYASLLIAVGALGIILANSITEPIVRIGDKLSDTDLRNNQPLNWPRQDEIGRLVQSYNQMIVALADSAEQLAASEREGAWREMARQVAHEIKNPLTPMKLQL
ncbi:MAG: sensor histidine kinase, partial [Bacteroidetes bacterium]